jgi:hypothetical protein
MIGAIILPLILNLKLDGGGWSTSRSGRCTPRKQYEADNYEVLKKLVFL